MKKLSVILLVLVVSCKSNKLTDTLLSDTQETVIECVNSIDYVTIIEKDTKIEAAMFLNPLYVVIDTGYVFNVLTTNKSLVDKTCSEYFHASNITFTVHIKYNQKEVEYINLKGILILTNTRELCHLVIN